MKNTSDQELQIARVVIVCHEVQGKRQRKWPDKHLREQDLTLDGVEGHNLVIAASGESKVSERILHACSDVFYSQQLLQFLLCDLILHEVKVEKVLRERSRIGLVIRVVISLEVRVRETLLHSHPVLWPDCYSKDQ